MKMKHLFNNNNIQKSVYGLSSQKTKSGIVIAHLSDLHEKEFGMRNLGLFFKVKELKPDLIMVTGDIVQHEVQDSANIEYARALAQGLVKIAPTFFVTGNHEKMFEKEICSAMEEGGAIVLKDEICSITIHGTHINICGIDDLSFDKSNAYNTIFRFSKMEGYNILLSHRPEVYDVCKGRNIDLVLAGHTHAGQFRIPFFSRLYMYGQGFFPKYMQGAFTDGDTTMIISRGLGASGFPTVRINNPPDLVAVYVS